MTTVSAVYRDAQRSVGERSADLVARMTRDEKLAQLGAVWGYELVTGNQVDIDQLSNLAAAGVGQITRLSGSTNLRPADAARAANDIQRFLVEQTRLGIPAVIHEECLHGLLALDAPCFQQSLGAAATFDPDLVAAVADTIRRRMLATGARHALGPVLDITRDPRWGRIEETYGEDPYVAAAMGAAFIRGLQGNDLTHGVLATAKHLVGHGMAEGGLNQAPAHVGPRELHDEQLVPFETAVVEAAVASVMPAYCEVDGLPCHASHELLTEVLRGRWHFDGVIVSDYAGIEMLSSAHRLTADLRVAAKMALEAGVDVEWPRTNVYDAPLREALEQGLVSEVLLDDAVQRILSLKFRLGLFEQPYVEVPDSGQLAEIALDEQHIGLELAGKSLVLVSNDGTLPLAAGTKRVALIGGAAQSPRDFLGDYSHLVHLETLLETRRTGSTAFGIINTERTFALEDELAGRATLVEELRGRLDGAELVFCGGVGVHGGSDEDIAQAVRAARDADVAIVVIAERSGLTTDSTTGEFRDRHDLVPSGRQQELLEAVVATGTPVVLVVVSGRPLALEWAEAHCAAIMLAWVPGDLGPAAIADALVGATEPGGRLPISMPRNVGQVPLNYRHHPTGGRSNPLGDYVDGPTTPLWPFGHGLSYSSFELRDLSLSTERVDTVEGCLTVSVEVTNTGQRRGAEVVQLYVRDEQASVARPLLELRGFQRVELRPGETRMVEFTLNPEQFAYTDAHNRRVIEAGAVRLWVGRSAADLALSATFELSGATVALDVRRHWLTTSRVV